MPTSSKLFLDALQIRFLTIRRYDIDYTHRIAPRPLPHSVLWYVQSGSLQVSVNGQKYAGNPGSLLLLAPGSTIGLHVRTVHVSLLSINFDADISYMRNRYWTDLLNLPVVFTLDEEGEPMTTLLEEMLAASREPGLLSQLLLQGQFQQLIAYLLRRHFQPEPPSRSVGSATRKANAETALLPSSLDPRIEAIVEYVLHHPSMPIHVAQLGELVHLSQSYLRKLFIRDTGHPPLQFLHQLKIDQSKQALIDREDPVSAIASQFGFRDPDHFSRLFRKLTGYTPSSYRKKYRGWKLE